MVSNDDYFPSILRVKNLSNLKVTLWVLDCLLACFLPQSCSEIGPFRSQHYMLNSHRVIMGDFL